MRFRRAHYCSVKIVGFPDDTDIMMPTPTATISPIAIQIGATRFRTPVCHRANATPTTRTEYDEVLVGSSAVDLTTDGASLLD